MHSCIHAPRFTRLSLDAFLQKDKMSHKSFSLHRSIYTRVKIPDLSFPQQGSSPPSKPIQLRCFESYAEREKDQGLTKRHINDRSRVLAPRSPKAGCRLTFPTRTVVHLVLRAYARYQAIAGNSSASSSPAASSRATARASSASPALFKRAIFQLTHEILRVPRVAWSAARASASADVVGLRWRAAGCAVWRWRVVRRARLETNRRVGVQVADDAL